MRIRSRSTQKNISGDHTQEHRSRPGRHRKTEIDGDRGRQGRQRETEGDRGTQTEIERDRERQREINVRIHTLSRHREP